MTEKDATAEWDVQCARCGSSLFYEPCESCDGEGGYFDDQDGEVDVWHECSSCEGEQTFPWCCSSQDWCESNPLPGRESVVRHTVEKFEVVGPVMEQNQEAG